MEKTVTTKQIQALIEAIRELADSSENALQRMQSAGVTAIESTNYQSALRGMELMFRFVDGVAGSATTVKARQLIAPILAEMEQVKEAAAKYESGRPKKKR